MLLKIFLIRVFLHQLVRECKQTICLMYCNACTLSLHELHFVMKDIVNSLIRAFSQY